MWAAPSQEMEGAGTHELLLDAWSSLLEKLDRASRMVLGSEGATDDLERAEGMRFLTRLTSAAFDMLIEHGDPACPSFVRLMTEHRKFYGDNPDTDYDYASIRSRHAYRITGCRGSSEYLACCVYGRDDAGQTQIVANVSDCDMAIGPDGRFELVLSLDPPAKPDSLWVPLTPDVDTVIVRQYFLDRSTETPASFSIECIDKATEANTPSTQVASLRPVALARRIRGAGSFVETGAHFSAVAAHMLATKPNELTIDSEARSAATFYPTPDNKYVGGWFRIEPDEALVVEGVPPAARYWSVLLMSRWMESLEQRSTTSLNKHQIELEDDGTFRVIVASRDPSVKNWLDTDGHREGYVMFRWMQASDVASPRFQLVKLSTITSS